MELSTLPLNHLCQWPSSYPPGNEFHKASEGEGRKDGVVTHICSILESRLCSPFWTHSTYMWWTALNNVLLSFWKIQKAQRRALSLQVLQLLSSSTVLWLHPPVGWPSALQPKPSPRQSSLRWQAKGQNWTCPYSHMWLWLLNPSLLADDVTNRVIPN